MSTNDLILGFLNDATSMKAAKALVCYTFDIQQQDFEAVLYGAFVKAWQSWKPEKAAFNTHVLTCLKSECLDYVRKEHKPMMAVEYVDKNPVGFDPEHIIYMKTIFELVLDKIIEHEDGDMLFRVLVCGDGYIAVSDNPAHARKIVERFRLSLKEEFGDIFN